MSITDLDPRRVRCLTQLSEQQLQQLSELLIDCVEGGASVGFMHPLPVAKALEFWHRVAADAASGDRALLVAEQDGVIVGTVQLILKQPDNQTHRADIAKMLVHRRARRRGFGASLMHAARETAQRRGKSLLLLDTVTGSDAERLYMRLGWQLAGRVPEYALLPQGGFCSTSFYYYRLSRPAD